MNRRWKSIVGTLPHVHVIVGVDRFGFGKPIATIDFDRPVGDHFVDVHVTGRSRAGLKDVNWELVIELSIDDVLGGGEHRVDLFCAERVFAGFSQFL